LRRSSYRMTFRLRRHGKRSAIAGSSTEETASAIALPTMARITTTATGTSARGSLLKNVTINRHSATQAQMTKVDAIYDPPGGDVRCAIA